MLQQNAAEELFVLMDVDKSDFISKEELINACLKYLQPCLLLLIERLIALT